MSSLPGGGLSFGDPALPAAVIAHGSASTADFVLRVFGPGLAEAGYRTVSWNRRTAPVSSGPELDALVCATEARVVGGISVGAAAAARYALAHADVVDGLLVALPPWVGPPDAAAALSAAAAEQVASLGVQAALAHVDATAVGWVAEEVQQAWPAYGDDLVAELRTAATTPMPTADELALCLVPTGVAALADDPLHPVSAGEAWVAALPHAVLNVVANDAPAAGLDVIGRAAVQAWLSAKQ